jgi:hypothetical protein
MKHLNEEQLVLYFYGEGAPRDAAAAEEHLAACVACRAQLDALKRDLAAVERATPAVPERGESYGAEVWQRLAPRLDERPEAGFDWRAWFRMPRLAWAGAMAVLLLAAFFAGRFGVPAGPGPETAAVPAEQVRERILIFAVGDHLERSQMLLVELVNAPSNGALDITAERRRAEDLLDVNRLYRQTAASAGETGLSAVLDELERTLLEIANSPAELSSAELEHIRKRIESQGILFKVRVLGSQVRERERQAIAQPLGRS